MFSPLNEKYQITHFAGLGASARVYKAIDIETGDQVAIKIASVGHNQTFERELRSYRLLNGVAGIPNIRWSGLKLGRCVLVMDWFPADVEQIFRCLPQSFTPSLVAAIAQHLIGILEHVHANGLVHGDIKPHNIAIAQTSSGSGMAFLIDFGLAKEIGPPDERGRPKNCRIFEGSPNFASINALRGRNQSPRDDLESLGYVLIYLLRKGRVPWDYLLMVSDDITRPSQSLLSLLAESKLAFCNHKADLGLPYPFQEFLCHARSLRYSDTPDYDRFKKAFGQLAEGRHD